MAKQFGVPLGEPVASPNARLPCGRPLTGRYCHLEKLDRAAHGAALWDCAAAEPADRWAYLGAVGPFGRGDEAAFDDLVAGHAASLDPFFYAVLPSGGQPQGWLSLMRPDIPNGVIETGWIWFSSGLGGTRAATEAMYLVMQYAFEDLGMRRYEWKCNALNKPSCSAAERLGFSFEGIFRQHQISRGLNRDTAWFSILDREWSHVKSAFEMWLEPKNFDSDGRQIRRLQEFRE